MIFTRRTRPSASSPDDQAELRRQADAARERLLAATVVRVPPPQPAGRSDADRVVATGCLLCGLGAVEVPGSLRLDGIADVPDLIATPDGAAGRPVKGRSTLAIDRGSLRAADVPPARLSPTVWQAVTCQPQAIGAAPSGSYVTGYLCPTCDDAVDYHDSLGAPAITAALGLDAANVEVTRRVGVTFGARVLDARRRGEPEPGPGRSRWEHVRIDTTEPDPPETAPIASDAMVWVPASALAAEPVGHGVAP